MNKNSFQVKRMAYVLCLIGMLCVVLAFSRCTGNYHYVEGPKGDSGLQGVTGATGVQGGQGYGAGVQVNQVLPGLMCSSGGVELVSYQDIDNNGQKDTNEPMTALNYVCNGVNGQDGAQGVTGATGATGATGPTGGQGVAGNDGSNGTDGQNTTFSVVSDVTHCVAGGFDITLTDYTHSETHYVCNGTQGATGNAGTNGANGSSGGTVSFSLVQAVMPCGYASSPWKEVILGLPGGQLIASFSDTASGLNTRFSFIPNGSYVDTDASSCHFAVSGNGSYSQINWSSGSNQYSNWIAGGYNWTQATGWVAL